MAKLTIDQLFALAQQRRRELKVLRAEEASAEQKLNDKRREAQLKGNELDDVLERLKQAMRAGNEEPYGAEDKEPFDHDR